MSSMTRPISLKQSFVKGPRSQRLYLGLLLGLAVLVVLATGMTTTVILKAHFKNQAKLEVQEKERELARIAMQESMAVTDLEFTHLFQLDNISIPLVDRNATEIMYAQFTLKMDCPNEEALERLELNRAKILNALFEVASHFYIEDFDDETGITRFKEALMEVYVRDYKKDAPRRLLIFNWIKG